MPSSRWWSDPTVLVSIFLAVATVVISVVGLRVFGSGTDQGQGTGIIFSIEVILTAAAVAFIAPLIWENSTNIKSLKRELLKESPVDKVLKILKEHCHGFICAIGQETINDQIHSIKPREGAFIIEGTDWAMRANQSFWRNLHRHARRVTCYVIHSSDPRFWKEAAALDALAEQETLISSKACISRIIVGQWPVDDVKSAVLAILAAGFGRFTSEESRKGLKHKFLESFTQNLRTPFHGEPTAKDYAEALILMYYHGITTFYSTDPFEEFSMEDFAVFKLDGTELVMRWDYRGKLGRVQRCEFEQRTNEVYINKWTSFVNRVNPSRTEDWLKQS